MKRIFPLLMLAVFALAACGPEHGTHQEGTPTGYIVGNVTVTNGDGEGIDYQKQNVKAELTLIDEQNSKYNIILYKVNFSSKMPVNIDMTIPGVDISAQGRISGDSIVPYAGLLGEYPKYTIRNLSGRVIFKEDGKPAAIYFDMLCGKYPTNYNGLYKEVEEQETQQDN
jgi:hypothetical protein